MRLTRFLILGGCAALFGACSNSDDVTINTPPALAHVRFINAMSDTGAVDVRMYDQIEYSAQALGLQFRSGTEYQGTEAKARHIRVFTTSQDIDITSKVMIDTTMSFEANRYYTLLLVGPARTGSHRFLVIEDDAPSVSATQIALRAVHAGAAATNLDGYATSGAADPLPATPVVANLAPLAASSYVTMVPGALAMQITPAGATTVLAAQTAPAGTAGTATINPAAGASVAGTAFSVYAFPASVAGSKAPQTAAFQAPGAIFFVDRLPPKTAN